MFRPMKSKWIVAAALLLPCFLLAACQSAPTPTSAPVLIPVPTEVLAEQPSPTPDPCAPPYVQILAQRVHAHMREFDDASTLAASLPVTSLPNAVSEMQRIRRAAEDEMIPSCLEGIRQVQISHMNAVINTFLAMMNGSPAEELQKSITAARSLHDEYITQLAVVLGATAPAPAP